MMTATADPQTKATNLGC